MKSKICLFLMAILLTSVVCASESVITPVQNVKDIVVNVRIQPIILTTNQVGWKVLDTTTMAGSEPNDLTATKGAGGYGGRTYAAVIADTNSGALEVSVVTIPQTWNGIKFRCIGVTDNNTVTYQIYAGTIADVNTDGKIPTGSNCALVNIGQLAFTIGGQVSDTSGYNFADQVTVTSYTTTKSWISYGAANDRVAQATIDLEGENILVLVPTTCNCNCKLLGKGF